MGGKFSREKGRRGEQQLVIYLANRNYKAERILRQYQTAGQPDVIAIKDNKQVTFELKCRQSSYKSIYDLYYLYKATDGVLAFSLEVDGKCVAVSTEFEPLELTRVFNNVRKSSLLNPKHLRVFERIVRLDALRQSADYLVIKDNAKPRLFIRFWN